MNQRCADETPARTRTGIEPERGEVDARNRGSMPADLFRGRPNDQTLPKTLEWQICRVETIRMRCAGTGKRMEYLHVDQ